MKTGQVTGLSLSCSMLYGTLHSNNSLFSLHHLQKLDLSFNDFNSSHISSRFGQFSNLTHLNLNNSNFAGQVQLEVSHLSKLVSLDLSGNTDLSVGPISFDKLVRNLTTLRELDLSLVDMSLVVPSSLMNLSSSLSFLSLEYCRLQGKFPSSMGNLKHLQYLNLASNHFTGSIPYDFGQLTKLVSLNLSGNDYLSVEPVCFDKLVQNLTKLRVLDLESVNMSLVAPNSLTNLSSTLSSLSLSGCGLQGKIQGNIFLLPNLELLLLQDNEGLTGSFPFSNVSNVLWWLDMSDTRISIYLENDSISNLKSLQYMILSNCNIVGSKLALFGNLTRLFQLVLTNNNFSGQIPSSFGNLLQLRYLYLSSNHFTGHIPDSFANLTLLAGLDLSNNQLNGMIPSFLFALPSLLNLDLHNNQFIGNIGEFQHNSLQYLDLSSNFLHGPIPSSIFKQENLVVLILASNSKLTWEVPSSICKLKSLLVLDLSNNNLSGSAPQCLGNFSNRLSVLHLGMNNLRGTIPSTFSEGSNLEYLNLNGNELEGKIPLSIVKCTMLEFLNLGNNKIEDTFPYFLEMLPELKILVLKSNKLQGFMKGPTTFNSFSKLHILDISENNFSGPLPEEFFNSLEAMISVDLDKFFMTARNYSSYTYSIKMTWKGFEIEFAKILSFLRVLDLSSNSFTGEIPLPIGKLKGLQQLNLSHNFLTGHIQSSLGFFIYLESLDMSSNMLTGRIPVQLTDLSFLGVLNLSQNKLEGPIPREKVFNTFDLSSFQGNLGLCGFPMPTKCNNGVVPPSNFNEGDDSTLFEDGFGWKVVAMGYGCGFVFGVTMGYIVFRTRRPAWFHRMVERQWNLKGGRTKKNARMYGARRN